MQTLDSVVNDRKPKMLTGFSCGGYGVSPLLRHGRTTLPAHREHLLYRVTSTEQGKPAALPARGSEVARPNDGAAGMRSGRKRMLFCNGADTGCVGVSTTSPDAKAGRLPWGASRERTGPIGL